MPKLRDLDKAVLASVDGSVGGRIALGEKDSLYGVNRFRCGMVGAKSQAPSEPVYSSDTADSNQRRLP